MGLTSRLNKLNDEAMTILKRKKKMELFKSSLSGWDYGKEPMPDDKFNDFIKAIYYNNQSLNNGYKR